MRIIHILIATVLLLSGLNTAFAGVIVGGTRVIYPEGKNEISLTIKNPDKNTDYLIQSWLDNTDENYNGKIPFVVTPPLFRLNRESSNVLRIADAGARLPTDRESLYWLSVKAIAGTPKQNQGNQLQVVVRTKIKFIYRPSALDAAGAADAYKALTFTRQGSELVATNPTPYYVSFYSLKVGGKNIESPGMVAPFGELRVKSPATGAIEWQSINDYGGYSAVAASR